MGNEPTTSLLRLQRLSGKIGKRKEGKERIFEVDLEYPKRLHKLHNDYPLAPEKNISTRGLAVLIPNNPAGKQKHVALLQAYPQSHEQEKVRSPLQKPPALPIPGYESDKNAQGA